ncbi:MAG: SURF1 family protein [Gammaproteobacteria bacterium]|nr:SURF1 family protein [Gammaproteobacteria bacterium]
MIIKRLQQYWAISVFTMFFLPLTIGLGFWQLDRADQKQQLQASLNALEEPVIIQQGQGLSKHKDYQRVILNGTFIKPFIWFKDNQIVKGKVGYDAIGLISLESTLGPQLLLINRGWLPSHGQRNPLPSVQWVNGEIYFEGRLVPIKPNPYQLRSDVYNDQYPQLIQALDLPQLTNQLGARLSGKFLPWVLILDAPGAATMVPHWKASIMTAEKHLGYAWQWFGLALTLSMLYIYRVFFSPSDIKKAHQ